MDNKSITKRAFGPPANPQWLVVMNAQADELKMRVHFQYPQSVAEAASNDELIHYVMNDTVHPVLIHSSMADCIKWCPVVLPEWQLRGLLADILACL